MPEHELKVWPAFYEAVRSGSKAFEVRHDDRGFAVGDVLLLRQFNPTAKRYANKPTLRRRVTYLMRGGQFGLAEGYVIMSITPEE